MSDNYHNHYCQLCGCESDCWNGQKDHPIATWCDTCKDAIYDMERAEGYVFMKLYDLVKKIEARLDASNKR
jgi:hypothetical protein